MSIGRLGTALVLAPLALAAPLSAQLVTGVTIDGTTGEALPSIRVEAASGDSTLAVALTGPEGRFALVLPDRPLYTLHFSALGYADLSLDLLPSGATLGPVTVLLTPEVIELEGITASVERAARPAEWTGFERRDSIGRGEHYLKSEFQKYPAVRTFQLLRQIPFVRTTPGGDIRIGGRCSPDIFVDGSLNLDLTIPDDPDFIIAVEVYQHPAIIPPRWRRPERRDQCGAVVIWTTVAGGGDA